LDVVRREGRERGQTIFSEKPRKEGVELLRKKKENVTGSSLLGGRGRRRSLRRERKKRKKGSVFSQKGEKGAFILQPTSRRGNGKGSCCRNSSTTPDIRTSEEILTLEKKDGKKTLTTLEGYKINRWRKRRGKKPLYSIFLKKEKDVLFVWGGTKEEETGQPQSYFLSGGEKKKKRKGRQRQILPSYLKNCALRIGGYGGKGRRLPLLLFFRKRKKKRAVSTCFTWRGEGGEGGRHNPFNVRERKKAHVVNFSALRREKEGVIERERT